MAISPYSPIAQQPLINTYVPLPYDDLLKAGLSKEAQYNAGEAAVGEADNLLKVQALREEEDLRNQLVDKYKSELASQVEKSGGDFAKVLPFVKQQARRIKEDLDRGQLGSIDKAAKAYQAAEADFAKRDAAGDFQGLSNEAKYVMLEQAKQDYLTKGGSRTPVNGTYNQFRPNALGKFSDWADDASKFAQQWAFDSGIGDIQKSNSGQYFKVVNNKWVEAPEVNEAVQGFLRNNTAYDQQRGAIESYYNAQGPGLGKQRLDEVISGIAAPIAARESFNQQDAQFLKNNELENQLTRTKIKALETPEEYAPEVYQTNLVNTQKDNKFAGTPLEKYWSDNWSFDSTGKLIRKGLDPINVLKGGTAGVVDDVVEYGKTVQEINNYRKSSKTMKNMTDQEILGIISQANDGSNLESSKVYSLNNLKRDEFSKYMSGILKTQTSRLSLADKPNLTGEAVLQDLGYDSNSDKTKALNNIEITGIMPSIGKYIGNIEDGSGNTVQVLIDGDDNMKNNFNPLSKITELEKSTKVGKKVIDINGAVIVGDTDFRVNAETGKWGYGTKTYQGQKVSDSDLKQYVKGMGKTEQELIDEGRIVKDGNSTVIVTGEYNFNDLTSKFIENHLNSKPMKGFKNKPNKMVNINI